MCDTTIFKLGDIVLSKRTGNIGVVIDVDRSLGRMAQLRVKWPTSAYRYSVEGAYGCADYLPSFSLLRSVEDNNTSNLIAELTKRIEALEDNTTQIL